MLSEPCKIWFYEFHSSAVGSKRKRYEQLCGDKAPHMFNPCINYKSEPVLNRRSPTMMKHHSDHVPFPRAALLFVPPATTPRVSSPHAVGSNACFARRSSARFVAAPSSFILPTLILRLSLSTETPRACASSSDDSRSSPNARDQKKQLDAEKANVNKHTSEANTDNLQDKSSPSTNTSSDDGDNNGSRDGPDSNDSDDDGDDGHESEDSAMPLAEDKKAQTANKNVVSRVLTDASTGVVTFVSSSQQALGQGLSSISSSISAGLRDLLKTVPAPVLVTLISLTSTFFGSRYKAFLDKQSKAAARVEAARKRKREVENDLRIKYEDYATPILKSASKLAQRLEMMVNVEWSAVEDGKSNTSPMYSAYLLGRFLAHVEILKNERALLDFGFPTADRILANILGRIQGVLSANDQTLMKIQNTEHFFKPYPGEDPIPAGRLKISPKTQTVIGQLLLRSTWSNLEKDPRYVFVAQSSNVSHGSKAVLTFLEFSQLIKKNKEMKYWYNDVVREFSVLESIINRRRNKRRFLTSKAQFNRQVGARVFFLQSALLDLVEFFDPSPHPQSVPVFERKRLQIGPHGYRDSQRSPQSLRKLYKELGTFREYRQNANASERLALKNNAIEVFVTGIYSTMVAKMYRNERYTDDGVHDNEFVEPSIRHANCPYTHRVLIALKEMGIPYQSVAICPDNKPNWYYLLHPMTQTPVIYYKGDVISDSSNIVSYLISKFGSNGSSPSPPSPSSSSSSPPYRSLASADKLQLARGTGALTKFNDHFLSWVSTGKCKFLWKTELELRRLNQVVEYAQKKNDGSPFLGGERFSREDTAVVPLLHFVDVAGRKGCNWRIPVDCKALEVYLEEARNQPSFEYPGAAEEAIMQRFEALRNVQVVKKKMERLADVLE